MVQNLITIDSELTDTQFRRIQRASDRQAGCDISDSTTWIPAGSRRQWSPGRDGIDPNVVARKMMVAAGVTFDYHVERLDN